jgi:hypothetical protein
MTQAEPAVMQGAIIALRLHDVAYAIDLAKAEALWTLAGRTGVARARLNATPAKAVAFGIPPLQIPLDPVALHLGGPPVQAALVARLYDFGAVTLALQLPAAGLAWAEFSALLNAVDHAVARASFWAEALATLRRIFAEAMERPSPSTIEEDYLIGLVERFDSAMEGAELLSRIDLVPLLSGETRPLSDAARRELLSRRFSYYKDDLVVLTWDRAFIVEPRGESDVLDVLEVANAQLLEMRYYDELLDAELPRMYDMVEGTRRAPGLLRAFTASRRFSGLARSLYSLVAEVTELTERVDNALQVTEDVYLARVYAAALGLFRVPTVSAAVDRKLSIIRDTYAALYEEAATGRAALMEAAVVALIVIEIILAIIR